MPKKITDNLSLVSHPLKIYQTNNTVATGTGFFYSSNEEHFFITAMHNVTGRHPETNEVFGIPNEIGIFFHNIDSESRYCGCFEHKLKLQNDNDDHIWWEHVDPVDVVVIPIDLPEEIKVMPINQIKFNDFCPITVGMDVFILGYPHGYASDPTIFPIWKRGTIATEPEIDIGGLPKIYIDAATAKGMSGSPVIAQSNGLHCPEGRLTDSSFWGIARQFIGIYTGRITDKTTADLDNEIFNAQLGFVWKQIVIDEIISNNSEKRL